MVVHSGRARTGGPQKNDKMLVDWLPLGKVEMQHNWKLQG